MNYYERTITVREPINKYGKLGYITAQEFVKTNNIEKFNKGKKIKFKESINAKHFLRIGKVVDQVYIVKEQLTSSQSYFRKSVSKYRR